MQQAQQYYKKLPAAVFGGWLTLAAASSGYAGIATRDAPEPLLHDGVKGPCDLRLDRPDLASGIDVNGNPVSPADMASAGNPVPGEILVPLRRGSRGRRPAEAPVIALDGKALAPILNPVSACPPGGH